MFKAAEKTAQEIRRFFSRQLIEHSTGLPRANTATREFPSTLCLKTKKKELSERKARAQRSAVSFLAVG
jgi:hypothetical protein